MHWYRKASASIVPASPGTTPIPEGTVRRFHCTDLKNIESIKAQGLTYSHARGIEGPRAIYSWPTWEQAKSYSDAAIVEFWQPKEAYDSNPYATLDDVPPSQIIAIHEPWHDHYRYMKETPEALETALSWTPEELASMPDYKKAVEAIQQERNS